MNDDRIYFAPIVRLCQDRKNQSRELGRAILYFLRIGKIGRGEEITTVGMAVRYPGKFNPFLCPLFDDSVQFFGVGDIAVLRGMPIVTVAANDAPDGAQNPSRFYRRSAEFTQKRFNRLPLYQKSLICENYCTLRRLLFCYRNYNTRTSICRMTSCGD